jgi:hypothetical protein
MVRIITYHHLSSPIITYHHNALTLIKLPFANLLSARHEPIIVRSQNSWLILENANAAPASELDPVCF